MEGMTKITHPNVIGIDIINSSYTSLYIFE